MSRAISIALIVPCSIFVMVSPGLTAAGTEQVESSLPPLLGHRDPAVEKCFSTLKSVPGCVEEVITSFLSHRVQLIGSTCCKALSEADNNCWPKVFTFNPFFPPLLKDHCTQILKNTATLPSPSSKK